MKLKRRQGLSFVHPYDDPEVIAGQGTIGMEILRQCEKPIDADAMSRSLKAGRRLKLEHVGLCAQ